MHVPAGERKQTGCAKENKFYSQKTFDETYYMITHSTHEMTEVLVLQSTLYISIINNHLPFPRLSVELLHTPNHIHWCAPGLVWLLHKNSGRFEPLGEGTDLMLEMFPSLLQCFGPHLICPLTSLRSVKDDTRSGTKDIFHQAYSKIQQKLFYRQACFSHQNGKVDDILYLICFFF